MLPPQLVPKPHRSIWITVYDRDEIESELTAWERFGSGRVIRRREVARLVVPAPIWGVSPRSLLEGAGSAILQHRDFPRR